MSSSITKSLAYNVEYNIPRVYLGSNVRQNRAIDGKLSLVPGADQPIEFFFGNKDGKFLNITNFKVKMIFWLNSRFNMNDSPDVLAKQQQEIVLTKLMEVKNGYEGQAFVLLTHDDTYTLHQRSGQTGIRWGVFLINSEEQVFPMVMTSAGGHYASVVFDYNAMPSYESIIGS